MVTRVLSCLLLASLFACGAKTPSDVRAERDLSLGVVETASYRLVAVDGLAHARLVAEDSVTLRASAPELSLTVTRKDPALAELRLRLWNLSRDFSLVAPPGVLNDAGAPDPGTPDPDLTHGAAWTVRFPSGVDEVRLTTPVATQAPFTFLAFGDIQNGIDRFEDVIAAVNQDAEAEFILMLGDLTMRAQAEEFDRVEAAYAKIRQPIYATPGNHDIDEGFGYQDRFGRANYSFVRHGVRFTSVDSGSADIAPLALEAFDGWSSQGAGQLHLVFSHIPAIDRFGVRSGQWNSRRQALRFLASASEGAVDGLFFGHIHSHDAYALGDIPAYISGGCGAFEEQLDGIGRHYLRVRVDPAAQTMDVQVVRVD